MGDMFNFSGELLASVSSAKGWNRYTTLELYKVGTGYVLHTVGGSPIPGEKDIHKYVELSGPDEVLSALKLTRMYSKYSKLALELLRAACAKDSLLTKEASDARKAGCKDKQRKKKVPKVSSGDRAPGKGNTLPELRDKTVRGKECRRRSR